MELNPYQKIIRNGELIQKGEMDTPIKFGQLTQNINLQGKTVLDIGCNLGAMCNIATVNGATTLGIDINQDYIIQAKSIFPNLRFQCLAAESIVGSYDIIIASAMLHYIGDLDNIFKVFAQCGKKVLCDIWLNDSTESIFTLSHRNIFIPSKLAFLHIVNKYFNKVEEKGLAITPDISKRYVFHLSDPKLSISKVVIIYGESSTGKTTLASTYVGYKLIMTDNINISWVMANRNSLFSAHWNSNFARGNYKDDYIKFFVSNILGNLSGCVNKNVVIEGYDLTFDDLRNPIVDYLKSNGWEVELINTTEKFNKEY